jgi:glycine dehydrogenase
MIPITWPEVGRLHPFIPLNQAQGYTEMMTSLEKSLADFTGFAAVSLQPNAGSQGEYAGLRVISAYHASQGNKHRNICLIPTSAHGTNPARFASSSIRSIYSFSFVCVLTFLHHLPFLLCPCLCQRCYVRPQDRRRRLR